MKWSGAIKPINVELPEDLHRAMKTQAPARGMTVKDAYAEALSVWLDKDDPLADGEFVKCPTHLRELIQKMIIRLHAMDAAMLPAMEKLLMRFSEPGAIEDILSDDGKRTLLGPRVVSHRKPS